MGERGEVRVAGRLSHRRPVERAGVRVAGGRVLCEDEDSVSVTYFAATAKRQGVYVFAHAGDKTTQLMTRTINDKLKDTLLGFSY